MSSRNGQCLVCEQRVIIRDKMCGDCGGAVIPDFPPRSMFSRAVGWIFDWFMARR